MGAWWSLSFLTKGEEKAKIWWVTCVIIKRTKKEDRQTRGYEMLTAVERTKAMAVRGSGAASKSSDNGAQNSYR